MKLLNPKEPNPEPIDKAPLSGAWYWFPKPSSDGVTWSILTCHDAGLSPETGHTKFWLWVLEHLAGAWGKDSGRFKRLLGDRYTGLPRGRVTRSGKSFLINHGQDAPVNGWQDLVVQRFHLADRRFKSVFDEHERMLTEDTRAVAEVLGISPA